MTDRELNNKKKKLLLSIKNDIKNLDNYIKVYEKDKFKIKINVNSKIALVRLQAVSPYLLSIALSSCVSLFALHDIPFFINDVQGKKYIKSEVDSFGNITYEEQYEDFNESNTISAYGAWVLDDDGFYRRDVIIYYADNYTVEELNNIILGNSTLPSNKKLEKIEKTKNLSLDDISKESYFEYTIYEEFNTDFMIQETIQHNVLYTIIWLIMTILSMASIGYICDNYFNFSYYESIAEIYQKYLPNGFDIDTMKEILKNKIENYEILKRK